MDRTPSEPAMTASTAAKGSRPSRGEESAGPREEAEGDGRGGRRGEAQPRAERVVEVGQLAAARPHGPGEAPAGEPAQTAAHLQGERGQAFRGGVLEKVAAGLADDVGGVAFSAELAGDEQDLALAFAPLAAGVDEKEAHRVILAQSGTLPEGTAASSLGRSSRRPDTNRYSPLRRKFLPDIIR